LREFAFGGYVNYISRHDEEKDVACLVHLTKQLCRVSTQETRFALAEPKAQRKNEQNKSDMVP